MKKLFIAVIGVVFSISAWAQTTGEIPIPLSDPAKRATLKVHVNRGSITVKGTGRKDILVKYSAAEGKKKEGETKDGLKRISSGTIDLEVSENSNNVKVNSESWNTKIDLEIEVPSGIDLRVEAYNNGDIIITNIQGELEIENYNGEITATEISGTVVASTYNGDIVIKYEKLTPNTPLSYSTYNGDIDLTFPNDIKATLKIKTERGDVLTDFDVELMKSGPVKKTETKSGTYKVVVDEWVRGNINGGGPEITMKNYNGDIKVRKK
jgi:hypothetical protein